MAKKKRKRRTKAEMQAAREAKGKKDTVKEKLEKGEITEQEILMSALPKEEKTKIVYVDKEVPVIKETRIVKDTQGTDLSVTDIIKQEIGKVKCWEYKEIPINEFNIKDLNKLGKQGWGFAFTISPSDSSSVKITKLIFKRAKM